jgi:hypothetical protein
VHLTKLAQEITESHDTEKQSPANHHNQKCPQHKSGSNDDAQNIMASNLNVSLLQRGDLLPSPTPSSPPASAASNTPTMSRSSSFHGQESKQLAFRGQSVKVILPDIPAEMIRWIDDVLSKVADIHEPEDEEVFAMSTSLR